MKKPVQPEYKDVFKGNTSKASKAIEVWEEGIAHLMDAGLLTGPRVRTVDRYARACAEYYDLYPVMTEEGAVKIGPNGGDVFNFNWSAIEKINERIGKFEDALLISPRSSQDKISVNAAPSTTPAADKYLNG